MNKRIHVVYGLEKILEKIEQSDWLPDKILVKKDFANSPIVQKIEQIAFKKAIPVNIPTDEQFYELAKIETDGVAVFSDIKFFYQDQIPQFLKSQKQPYLLILLDQVINHNNIGTISRTAEAAGANALIIPRYPALTLNKKALNASAGALTQIPIIRTNNPLQSVKLLKQQFNFKVIAADMKGSNPYFKVDFTQNTLIILGSETEGISEQMLKLADEIAFIPQYGAVESLNVAAAGAILIYEAVRQRINAGIIPVPDQFLKS